VEKIEKEFISIKEVAVIFSVNEITIRRAIKKGWIKAIKIGEGSRSPYRISRKSIDDIHISLIRKYIPAIIMGHEIQPSRPDIL
jgi:excisionase family DNA binding protein